MIAQLSPLYIRTRPLKAWGRLVSYALFEGRPATTKGRWINPLVLGLFALEKRLPALKRVEKPIYIVGVGRSGTTVTSTARLKVSRVNRMTMAGLPAVVTAPSQTGKWTCLTTGRSENA